MHPPTHSAEQASEHGAGLVGGPLGETGGGVGLGGLVGLEVRPLPPPRPPPPPRNPIEDPITTAAIASRKAFRPAPRRSAMAPWEVTRSGTLVGGGREKGEGRGARGKGEAE